MQDHEVAVTATLASLLHAELTRPESVVSPPLKGTLNESCLYDWPPPPPVASFGPICIRLSATRRTCGKVDIAAHVFATWTARGTRAAHLADRFLDGSIEKLEEFLSSSPAERIPSAEEQRSYARHSGLGDR